MYIVVNKEQLLMLLQDNSKLSAAQLGAMLGAPEGEILSAVQSLEKNGVIKGYKAMINWEKAESKVASALIEVKVTPQRDTGFDEMAKRIMDFPEVEFVYLMSGGYDLAVKVNAPTMSEVAMFVSKRLATIGGILSTVTHFVLTKYKDGNLIYASDYEEFDERGSNLCD